MKNVGFMGIVKKAGCALLLLPFALVGIFVLYEILGVCVNHAATKLQTEGLKENLESEIQDVEILEIYSETGNTSGTGNHVDCLSRITFSTEMELSQIEERMSGYYEIDAWSCYVKETEDGNYVISINTSAPFADNIEGH